jgi:hypothetical protein
MLDSPDFFDSEKIEPIKAEIRTFLDDIELFAELGGYLFYDLVHLNDGLNLIMKDPLLRDSSSQGSRISFFILS